MADKGKLSGNDIIRATEQPRAARMHTRAGSDIAGTSDQSAGLTEIAARGGIARTSEPLAAGMTDFPGASSQSGGAVSGGGGGSGHGGFAPARQGARERVTATTLAAGGFPDASSMIHAAPLGRGRAWRAPPRRPVFPPPQGNPAPLGRGGAWRAPPRRPTLPPLQGNPADAPLQRACRSCNTPTTWDLVCRDTTTGLLVSVPLCQDCAREQQLRAELAALEERMLVAANILNNPFSIICEACGHPSGTNKNVCRVLEKLFDRGGIGDNRKLGGDGVTRATEQTTAGGDIAGTSDQPAGLTEIAARGGIARTSQRLAVAAGMTDFPGASSSQLDGAARGGGDGSGHGGLAPARQGARARATATTLAAGGFPDASSLIHGADAPLQRACRSCNTPTAWGCVCRDTTTGLLVSMPLCQDCAREQQLRAELAALEERMLVAVNILNNPFSIICEACGHPSGTNKNACRVCNPSGTAPPQHAQIGAHRGAVTATAGELESHDAELLAARTIFDNPFSISGVRPGPICDACGRRSGSNNACQACYNYAQVQGAIEPSPVGSQRVAGPGPSN
ncbi:hypothetical protein ZWY2020_018484 [Hordeum vulgare]|nr:hypothetical protein ZWY2020_018484 [Hordeum vulgare]